MLKAEMAEYTGVPRIAKPELNYYYINVGSIGKTHQTVHFSAGLLCSFSRFQSLNAFFAHTFVLRVDFSSQTN